MLPRHFPLQALPSATPQCGPLCPARPQHWVGELQRNAAGQQQALVLVGNKADLEGERAVSRDEALKLANRCGGLRGV